MNLTQTRQILEIAWRLNASGKISNMPIFTLVGDTGIGKSTIMADFHNFLGATEQAHYFSAKYLAQVEVGDLIGMPDRKNDKTIWLAPDWWPEATDRGILFFDELSDAKTDVRAAVMPMLLTRRMHQNVLPNDILIICAMNPVGGEFGGYTFTRQFKDRLAFLKVTPTLEEWVAYANGIGLPLYSKNMISEQPDFFLDMKQGQHDDTDWTTSEYYNGTPSRRSVTTAIQIYENMTPDERESVGIEMLSAVAGDAVAASIMSYSKRTVDELINPKDIFDDLKAPAILMKVNDWVQKDAVERMGSFVKLLKAMLKSDGVTKNQIKPLADLLAILPEDISVGVFTYIQSDVKSGKMLMLQLASDSRIFARIDRMLCPGKYKQAVAVDVAKEIQC